MGTGNSLWMRMKVGGKNSGLREMWGFFFSSFCEWDVTDSVCRRIDRCGGQLD